MPDTFKGVKEGDAYKYGRLTVYTTKKYAEKVKKYAKKRNISVTALILSLLEKEVPQ